MKLLDSGLRRNDGFKEIAGFYEIVNLDKRFVYITSMGICSYINSFRQLVKIQCRNFRGLGGALLMGFTILSEFSQFLSSEHSVNTALTMGFIMIQFKIFNWP